jgi:hypothetical protein
VLLENTYRTVHAVAKLVRILCRRHLFDDVVWLGLQAVKLNLLVLFVIKTFQCCCWVGLQAVVLLSLVVLLAFKFINAVVQGWDCKLWCC